MKEISEQEMSDAKQSLQKAQQSSEDRKDKLAKALEDIEKALEKLAKMQEKMNEGLDNLEALTLAQRLREAAKSEQQIERELLSMAPETIGLKFDRMSARYQKATVKAAATQNEVRDEAEKLQAEISRFFERTQRPNYGEVAEEMEASETYEKLKFVSLLIGANTTMQSIERLTHWSEQFEAWAKHIDPEPQESGESGEGEYSQDDLMQLLVAMIRMRAEQDNLRGRTGMLEEQKARDPNYAKRVGELADDQGELKGKMDDIVRKNPVEVLDGILRETGGSMAATLQQLAKPDTGADTVQAEMRTIRLMTDVINLINEQSQQQQQQQQQSAQPGQEREFIMEMAEQQPGEAPGQQPGAMPGMGPRAGDGSLPNGKPTGNGLGKGAANRRVGHASGATRPVPSEFRAAMESYFKGVESIE
jgi:Asp-tRNA(Asn)/Glu-tRNA(Gln) amidotransferase C subunit